MVPWPPQPLPVMGVRHLCSLACHPCMLEASRAYGKGRALVFLIFTFWMELRRQQQQYLQWRAAPNCLLKVNCAPRCAVQAATASHAWARGSLLATASFMGSQTLSYLLGECSGSKSGTVNQKVLPVLSLDMAPM